MSLTAIEASGPAGSAELAGTATARRLEREASLRLGEATASLQQRGQRERYRELLAAAHACATGALSAAEAQGSSAPGAAGTAHRCAARSRSTLVKIYAAQAEDALHGAGQLSLSAQRAPTSEACDDGWRRVATLAVSAETFAGQAASVASELARAEPLAGARARPAVLRAQAAAAAARGLVEQRNHAYTFHTGAGFSFGEGWYLAAAAVLASVSIQIEPGAGVLEVETFLEQAGLKHLIRPYRSRPRGMKHVTEIVGRAFRPDPAAAQRRLRAAFLGAQPILPHVSRWIEARLASAGARGRAKQKVLVWIRDGAHHPGRNTEHAELCELTQRVAQAGMAPVLIGDAVRGGEVPSDAIDMILFWKDPIFRRADRRRAQLQFFEYLRTAHGLVGQLGVTTAGMDGPALMGLPTLYLTAAPNFRMREWVGAVPGYREVVRESGYLEVVSRVLEEWRGDPVSP